MVQRAAALRRRSSRGGKKAAAAATAKRTFIKQQCSRFRKRKGKKLKKKILRERVQKNITDRG